MFYKHFQQMFVNHSYDLWKMLWKYLVSAGLITFTECFKSTRKIVSLNMVLATLLKHFTDADNKCFKNIAKIFRELRIQRFYLIFSDILHVTHLHFPFLYWWAFKVNQRLKIISPFWNSLLFYIFLNFKIIIWNFGWFYWRIIEKSIIQTSYM